MPFGICALRAVDALGTRTAMALDCRCHRSAEGEDALLRCVLLRTRCVKGAGAGPGLGIGLVLGLVLVLVWLWLAAREVGCLSLSCNPRYEFPLYALPLCRAACLFACIHGLAAWRCRFGLLVISLASAFCLRASGVAPVRGGTYFSLPPQRKVGKRKRLTPPTFLPA